MFLLEFDRTRNFLRQRKNQRNHVLCNDGPMHLTRIRKNDVTLDEFGKHQLVHGSRRRMNPAQSLRRRDLLRPKRPRNDDLGAGNFGVESFVVGKVNDIEFAKVGTQALGEPRRGVPLIKRMVNGDK